MLVKVANLLCFWSKPETQEDTLFLSSDVHFAMRILFLVVTAEVQIIEILNFGSIIRVSYTTTRPAMVRRYIEADNYSKRHQLSVTITSSPQD